MKTITQEHWYELNKDLVNNVYNDILNHVFARCTIPKHYNKNIIIDHDKLYDDLMYYLYKTGNSKFLNSNTYISTVEQYNKKLDKYYHD